MIYISKDSIFHERVFPYSTMFPVNHDAFKVQLNSSESLSFHSLTSYHMVQPPPIGNTRSSLQNNTLDLVNSLVRVADSFPNAYESNDALSSHSVTTPSHTSSLSSPLPVSEPSKVMPISSNTLSLLISNSTYSRSPYIHSSSTPHINQFNEHPMMTKSKIGRSKPKSLIGHVDPTFVKQTLAHPDWSKAMQSEYESLLANHT